MKKAIKKVLAAFLVVVMLLSAAPLGEIANLDFGNLFGVEAEAVQATFTWPVPDTPQTNITSGFGNRKYIYQGQWVSDYHDAIDIAANVGDKVVAAADATVYKTGSNSGAGWYIILRHDTGGYYTFYCHLSSIWVEENGHVRAGEQIGKAGQSGKVTGSHLDFKVSWDADWYSTKIDPTPGRNFNYVDGSVPPPAPPSTGYYRAKYDSINVRWGAGTNNDTTGEYFNTGDVISVVETAIAGGRSWGKIEGTSKWTCLDYFEKTSNPKPGRPSITSSNSGNIAVGKTDVISWSGVSNAGGYKVYVNGSEVQNSTQTRYDLKLTNAGNYSVYVVAYNSTGSSEKSNTISYTAKNPSTVTFLDWDGREHNVQKVDYGADAVMPPAPSREGYTFTGWDKSLNKITSNVTINATYKINTYKIKFIDDENNILSTQTIEYNSSAVPPTVTPATGHVFVGWSSELYKNVKADATIQAVCKWGNEDLPIVANITSAFRQKDGYYVYFDLTNYPKQYTRGRAVVSLKTADGKLVDATESTAFSIPKNGTKTGVEVFVPSDCTATIAEVVILNGYKSVVPLSAKVAATIDESESWSNWSDTRQTGTSIEEDTQTLYMYRDKETSKGDYKTMSGWTWDGTKNTIEYGWADSGRNAVSAINNEHQKREVTTYSIPTTYDTYQYCYYHWYTPSWAYNYDHVYCSVWHNNYSELHEIYVPNYLEAWDWSNDTNERAYRYADCPQCAGRTNSNIWWFRNSSKDIKTTHQGSPVTGYKYKDTFYTYNFFRWKPWSDWSKTEYTATADRQVETKTQYRYRSGTGADDASGVVRTQSGMLDPTFAGKQITLFVYKVDEASDYSNEYVGQTVINADGSYSFTYKLREEPSIKTGDFTVAIGIEGTSNTIIVDTIEAPKPTFTVTFRDWDGSIVDTKTAIEGESVTLPDAPEREGYNFVGWDNSLTNVKDNIEVNARYVIKTYTVVYVDWIKRTVSTKTYEHGSPVELPTPESSYGYDFAGWNGIDAEIIATENMILTAEYDAKEYSVKFYDFDGNVISNQTVAYGNTSDIPDDLENENIIFLGWDYDGDLTNVDRDLIVVPRYVFKETAETPTIDLETGSYDTAQTITLSCATDRSVIYYTTDGSDPASRGGIEYTEPFTIDKTCKLRVIASCFNMNDSAEVDAYYAINDGLMSDWMAFADIPKYIKDNLNLFGLQMRTGYRYRDTVSTTSTSNRDSYLSNGWTVDGEEWSEFSEWSRVEPNYPDSEIEVESREPAPIMKTGFSYERYKYTNDQGVICYSKDEVEGFVCEKEEYPTLTTLDLIGLGDGNPENFVYKDEQGNEWFNQKENVQIPVVPDYTEYRYRTKQYNLYKWTAWTIDAPTADETREYESSMVGQYTGYACNVIGVSYPIGGGDLAYFFNNSHDLLNMSNIETNVEGFTFKGLYTDPNHTDRWDIESDTVTEDLILYAKYEINTYTVSFKNSDGTVLKTESVEYGSSVTPPEVPVSDGYAFVRWNSNDYENVTKDLTITAVVMPEDEIVKVTLNRTKFSMMEGSSFKLSATVTPDNIESTAVVWASSDYGIADVDYNGYVTALNAGTVTISATAFDGTKAECVIKIIGNPENYITLKATTDYTIDRGGFVRGVSITSDEDEGTNYAQTVSEAKEQFVTKDLVFVDINGETLDDDDLVGTGTVACIIDNGVVVDSVTFVVTGDTNGDGKINNRDVAIAMSYLVDKLNASAAQVVAFDVNGDGSVNNRDASMLARYLVGKETI